VICFPPQTGSPVRRKVYSVKADTASVPESTGLSVLPSLFIQFVRLCFDVIVYVIDFLFSNTIHYIYFHAWYNQIL
jgi:hypothetical protein